MNLTMFPFDISYIEFVCMCVDFIETKIFKQFL